MANAIESWGATATSDSEVFRGWASTFDRECRTNRWLSRSGLAALLTESIQQGFIDLPQEILLIGLDRLTPAQRKPIDAARTAGTAVNELQTATARSPLLIQAKDQRDELVTCAWWLRRKLEENPSASIAVIVQGAEEMRGEIHRIFGAILMPESSGVETTDAMPFEFSLGVPLATVPLVKAALLTLRWLAEPLDQPAISWLAISGFLAADGEDLLEMAEFDAELRKRSQLPPEASLDAFLGYSPRLDSRTVRQFRSRLRDLQRAAQAEGIGNRKTFPEWIAVTEMLLRLLRWPGARTLESVEFQARARWERLLGEIAALGFDGSRVGWAEFVTVLDRYAAETIFAPESRGAPIQIMGPLESAGQNFDALWFLGRRRWPLAARGPAQSSLAPLASAQSRDATCQYRRRLGLASRNHASNRIQRDGVHLQPRPSRRNWRTPLFSAAEGSPWVTAAGVFLRADANYAASACPIAAPSPHSLDRGCIVDTMAQGDFCRRSRNSQTPVSLRISVFRRAPTRRRRT